MADIFGDEDLFDVFDKETPVVTRKSRKFEDEDNNIEESPASPVPEEATTTRTSPSKKKKKKSKKEGGRGKVKKEDESSDNEGKQEKKASDNEIASPSPEKEVENDQEDTEMRSPSFSPKSKKGKKRKSVKVGKGEEEANNDDSAEEGKEDDDEDDDEGDVPKRPKLMEDMEALQKYLPKVTVQTLETPEGSGCTHVTAIPNSTIYIPLHPIVDPVKTYSFKLDVFQNLAVTCVDNYQSVLVSAHTSAGKTVVAEYAIAKGLKDNQRVIYTTPIKALSNQKYREFYEEFKDVGLITGDVTINPSAGCLIMTTEILRNMLYRGSEIMREVGWVVFDEIHYMRDKERGVVWEETIILLPQKTHYVFLSATIPNAVQFAEWIAHLHKQPCNVIHTDYRPVPLHHYIYPEGGDGIHLVVDENGVFREDGFSTAMSMIQNKEGGGGGGGGGRRGGKAKSQGEDSSCHKVIKMAMEHDLAPVIIFSFSKKDCEIYAMQMSKLDFNTAEDKTLVEEVFTNAIDVLSKEDQKLPQVENLLPLLKRGIGIHHGGLLPLLKETIEILFSEGLIKCLFATETFAMGLNMPARTVLFTNVRKYDGKSYRWITSGEYIQMSGRAGRRGIDDKGVCIVMIDENISASVGRSLLKGAADAINSEFHLTYNMVLNLMRVEEINPEFMMERSFFQFQNYSSIPAICEKMIKCEKEYSSIVIDREEDVASYFHLRKQLSIFSQDFRSFITRPKHILPFLQPGRLIHVKNGPNDFGWGAVVNFKKQDTPGENPLTSQPIYTVEVLLHLAQDSAEAKSTRDLKPCPRGEKGEMKVVPITLAVIEKLSQVRLYFSNDLRPLDNRMAVLKSIQEVQKRFKKDGVPLLDPVKDMAIKDKEFDSIIDNIQKYEERLLNHTLTQNPTTPELYDKYNQKMKHHEALLDTKAELKKAKSLLQMDELKCRKRVLRRLGYSSGDDVIEIKGRVACELTSGDELLLTEMLFHGIFIDLDTAKCVALLSCLVCDERSQEVPKLSEEMSGALKLMQDIARQIAKVSKESKLELDEDTYVDQFRPFLMDVVHEWCNGASFSKICEMTDIFEGGIIRCMRRLEELLRQMAQAAKVIGNKELEEKFSDGVKLIKRDIVFAASLYL